MSDLVIAIILGRKGSKGVKDKNVMNILGKPSYDYSFSAARDSKFVKEIFVTTDHPEILKTAEKENFQIINRPDYLCTDNALFEDALKHGYEEAKKILNQKPKYVVVLMCNSVTINSLLIDKSIEKLKSRKDADSIVTVIKLNMYSPLRARKINKDGFLDPFVPFTAFGDPSKLNCDRGSQGDVLFAEMSHSICKADCLENMSEGLLPQKWMGQKILPMMNQNGCDIDEPFQIDMSIRWLKDNKS